MIKKLTLGIGILVFFLFAARGVFSQNTTNLTQALFGGGEQEDIILVNGEVSVVNVSFPQRVSIRNPDIADISKVSDKEVVVVAKKAGDTALNIWDKEGEKVYYITVYDQDLDRVKDRLEKLIRKDLKVSNVILKKNESTGKIIIIGDVSALAKEQIEKVVDPFKDRVENILTVKKESKMVEIEARILELNKSELDKLGVEWQEYIQIRQEPYKTTGTSTSGVQTTLDIQKPWEAIWGMGSWSRDALTAKINTLIRTGKGKELSRPKILCLSGEEAKLTVGGEVPYVTGSTTGSAGTSVNIAYKEYGVILKIRPIVSLDNKKIYASLHSEVSALDWANAVTLSGVKVPAFSTRIAETVLNLKSGDTMFIAGLIKNKDSEGLQKFPALGEVPIVGMLFRSKDFQASQTELVISLTPRVVIQEEEIIESKDKLDQRTMELYTGILPDELKDYVATVQKQISDNISYPPSIINTGWEGMAVLKLNITHTGELKEVRVSKSSGHRIFDNEAVKLVKSLSFPPFPPDVGLEELNIEIPIVYREKNKR
ncbi:MAG: TonB family protein [Candidatus Omnitrophota bacterium]|nr:TonB family protein [Candidatus Omnitrophota bacterium]